MELPSILLLAPENAHRPVDARWQRVTDLADRGKRAWHKWDDSWVRHGLLYLSRLRACRREGDRQHLAGQMPDIDIAYRLHETKDKIARGILEARLLAGQTIDEVAQSCGLTREAVTAYVRLFFDIVGKLGARIYILIHAIGPKHFHGLTEDDPDVILKWAGFVKGLVILEPLIRYYTCDWRGPERLESLSQGELDELYTMLQMRLLILSRVLPPNRYRRVLAMLDLAERLEAFLDSRSGGAENVSVNGRLDSILIAEQGWWIGARRTAASDTCQGKAVQRKTNSAEDTTCVAAEPIPARVRAGGVVHGLADQRESPLLLPFSAPQRPCPERLSRQRPRCAVGRSPDRTTPPAGAESSPGSPGRAGEVGPGDHDIGELCCGDGQAYTRRSRGGWISPAPSPMAEEKNA